MSEGMQWASRTFHDQGGVLDGGRQLSRYCAAVLGNPIRFSVRIFHWEKGLGAELPSELEDSVWAVGEFLQLANITRDIEKDLMRGVSYHPELRAFAELRSAEDSAAIASARSALCERALSLAPSYLSLVEGMMLRGLMGTSALMMLLFTEQHYRASAALAAGAPRLRSSGSAIILKALPYALSGAWARWEMRRIVRRLGKLRDALPPQASSMYLS